MEYTLFPVSKKAMNLFVATKPAKKKHFTMAKKVNAYFSKTTGKKILENYIFK